MNNNDSFKVCITRDCTLSPYCLDFHGKFSNSYWRKKDQATAPREGMHVLPNLVVREKSYIYKTYLPHKTDTVGLWS